MSNLRCSLSLQCVVFFVCTLNGQAQEAPPPLVPESSGVNKCRFVSFEVPTENATFGPTAIRINFTT